MNFILPSEYDFVYRFYRLATINFLSNLMVPLSGLISVAFLGNLGDINVLAGVALANIFFNVIYFSLSFLRMATTGVTAQAIGKNDPQAVLLVGLRNALIALGLGTALVILQHPLREVGFALLNGTLDIKASGIAYFNARIWAAPAVLLNFVLIGWLMGQEQNCKVLVLSIIGNAANIILDYLLIAKLGLNSTGAGIAQASSQYIMLLIGIVFASSGIQWKDIRAVIPKLRDLSVFKTTFALNIDIFTRTVTEVSVVSFSNNLGGLMGTILFTQNALLSQIVFISLYPTEGFGYAVETLIGNFKGQERKEKFLPLIRVSLISGLLLTFSIAGTCVLFPRTVFGIFTNHTEITGDIDTYVWWLFFILGFSSSCQTLEGYFLGLANGSVIRNISLITTGIAFTPLAIATWYFHNNHILWLSKSLFLVTKTFLLSIYVLKSLANNIDDYKLSYRTVDNN
ncbi:MATE family efflux transporter [Aetokthonos hydrillicola Thurmond2011]|jgi:MATE family multidrug resistance protein|uniref:Probable multidrug resistance protein NorM n=1 Tax=Aetokthonos hydrillicola Thurmond2011 TaxID=2712845 RepID=A0AAP5I2J9_9CYAN|nr:guanitoxin biosynthesis MATE family efflux transporter GntT [Aetokthonos hydrillicola]MBO3458265.1 MATE family efflux transporter [Aetokthonos hydrillicola CCALA 1050]MBW4586726.1 MATE family efflux transporter [Aetokthonos hydrillicola CCALA 1050]MDR9893948.1 MATE family efflux transporter [Aetokthonos hydrillicola Thurmond2011]